MDWSRAKSLVILFLVIVNVFLFSLNVVANNKFKVTTSDKNDIIKLLSESGIELNCKIPTYFKPQKQLLLAEIKCNPDFWKNFLMEDRNVTESVEGEEVTFRSDDELLKINGVNVYYERLSKNESDVIKNENDAKILCNSIVKKLNFAYTDFQLSYLDHKKDDYYVYYNQTYSGKTFVDNFIKFHLTSGGIKSIEISYRNLKGYVGKAYEIYSPIDVLFTFLRENKVLMGKDKMYINNIELVYHSLEDDKFAIPCYFLEIDDYDRPILIDAYHNFIISTYENF